MGKQNDGNNTKMDYLTIIVSIVALAISIFSLWYASYHDRAMENVESFFDPLDYTIEFDEDYSPKLITDKDGESTISSPGISVIPNSGGIKGISVVYYLDGECYHIGKLEFAEGLDRRAFHASDLFPKITEFTQACFSIEESSKYCKGYDKSYYLTLYLVVYDYNGGKSVSPIVIEYPLNPDGTPAKDYNHREYSELDLLYASNDKIHPLPKYDTAMLKDYRELLKNIDNN